MKYSFCGLFAALAVLGYGNFDVVYASCSTVEPRAQTVHITTGNQSAQRAARAPQVVSNTVTRVDGVPTITVDVHAPDEYVTRGGPCNVGDCGYSGGFVESDFIDDVPRGRSQSGGGAVAPSYSGGYRNYQAPAYNGSSNGGNYNGGNSSRRVQGYAPVASSRSSSSMAYPRQNNVPVTAQPTYRQPTTYQRPQQAAQTEYRQPTTYQRQGYPQSNNYSNRNNTYASREGYYAEPQVSQSRTNQSRSYSYDDMVYDDGEYWDASAWYVGGRIGLHLLNWSNTYTAYPPAAIVDQSADHDDYRFKPVIGGDLFIGYRFNDRWRTDLEFGFTSNYSDSDNGITFELSVPHVTANVYYQFVNGLYLGGGLGAAFPTIQMKWENFTANRSRETGTSFAVAGMVGYSYNLSKSLILDFRYRLGGYNGTSITRGVSDFGVLESLNTKVGFIFDNSISVGLRYEF